MGASIMYHDPGLSLCKERLGRHAEGCDLWEFRDFDGGAFGRVSSGRQLTVKGLACENGGGAPLGSGVFWG